MSWEEFKADAAKEWEEDPVEFVRTGCLMVLLASFVGVIALVGLGIAILIAIAAAMGVAAAFTSGWAAIVLVPISLVAFLVSLAWYPAAVLSIYQDVWKENNQ